MNVIRRYRAASTAMIMMTVFIFMKIVFLYPGSEHDPPEKAAAQLAAACFETMTLADPINVPL